MEGGIWQNNIQPYTHSTVAYGAIVAGLPSQVANGSWQKI